MTAFAASSTPNANVERSDPAAPVFLLAALGLALVAHAAAAFKLGDVRLSANIWEYGVQGQCALRHGGDLCQYYNFDGKASYPSAYMPPLLSYLWLVDFAVFGDSELARGVWLALNVVMSAVNAGLLFVLSRRWGLGAVAAFFASALLSVYPTYLAVVSTYHQTEWAVFFLLSLSLLLTEALSKTAAPGRYLVLAGVISALAALNRSEMIVIGPALIVAAGALRRAPRATLAGLAMIPLVLSPWVARNYIVFHKIIPVAQSSGYNLWKGFNPYTNGSGKMTEQAGSPGDRMRWAVQDATPHGRYFEVDLQDRFQKMFVDYIKSAGVGRLIELCVTKAALLWVFDWTDTKVTGTIVYRIPWEVANLLAGWGAYRLWRTRALSRTGVLIGGAMLGLLTLAYMATAVHARYRMHIEPFLFVAAGFGLDDLRRRAAAVFTSATQRAGKRPVDLAS